MDAQSTPATADDSGHGGLQILIGAGPSRFVADEPVAVGGLSLGPTPHDLVSAGLAACTSQTLRLYAKRKAWPLGAVHVEVTHTRKAGEQPADTFIRHIRLGGELSDEQRTRLMEIADMCPIHRLLTAGARVTTEMDSFSPSFALSQRLQSERPPSTNKSIPVTKPAPGEAR